MDERRTSVATENRSRDQRQNAHFASKGVREAPTKQLTEVANVPMPVLESLPGMACASMTAYPLFRLPLPT
jgi:hypothetical protein